jgi:hypothetical protein
MQVLRNQRLKSRIEVAQVSLSSLDSVRKFCKARTLLTSSAYLFLEDMRIKW